MKTLFLIRHAKSDWTNHQFEDQERPLNQRGLRDAPLMAQRLKVVNLLPDGIISSPAVRTQSTARVFAEFLDFPPQRIKTEPLLYNSNKKVLLSIINSLNQKLNNVLIIGHNPALTEMVNYLTDYDLPNLPTTGVAMIAFELDNWELVSKHTGVLKMLDYPKKT